VSKSDRKIEHFINGITQNGFTGVLSENAALLIETTALKDKIQELEETLENMQARVDELCKERQVSTIQKPSARKKRAMPQ
jgi:regulator of replication initiation timing